MRAISLQAIDEWRRIKPIEFDARKPLDMLQQGQPGLDQCDGDHSDALDWTACAGSHNARKRTNAPLQYTAQLVFCAAVHPGDALAHFTGHLA